MEKNEGETSIQRRKSRLNAFQEFKLTARLRIRATAIIAATSAATTAAAATGTAIFTRACFVDSEVAAADLLAVGGFDRGGAFSGAAHGHESETAGAAGGVIGHESDFTDSPVLIEQVFEVVFGGIEG